MDAAMIVNVVVLAGITFIAVALLALWTRLRAAQSAPEVTAHLQSVSQSVSQGAIQAAAMAERLTQSGTSGEESVSCTNRVAWSDGATCNCRAISVLGIPWCRRL